MIRHLRILAIAAMVGVLAMGMATPARADLEIWISTTNNPPLSTDVKATAASGGTAIFNGTVGTFAFNTLDVSSNSPGTAASTKLLGATLDLTNTGSSTATIFITMGDTGFTQPVAPPTITFLSHVHGRQRQLGQSL